VRLIRTLAVGFLIALIGSISALQHIADGAEAPAMIAMAGMPQTGDAHDQMGDGAIPACPSLCIGSTHDLFLPLVASTMQFRRSMLSFPDDAMAATMDTMPRERPPRIA